MAVSSSSKSMIILFSFLFLAYSLNVIEAGFGRTRLGGISEIKDVKNNKEVQDLGKYCVEKYNLKPQNEIGKLQFLQVVKAEQQVVSGTKYYLKISAAPSPSPSPSTTDPASKKKGVQQQQQQKMFDAVVVVKLWVPSKELLEFSPSTQ